MDTVVIPQDLASLAGRLALATLLGALVGLDRELSQKPAGLRTHALVALGAAVATLTGLFLTRGETQDTEATGRVIQGIVAGIGFIGGGVILHLRESKEVLGLTTAASTWVVAAMGIAVGAGLWRTALITAGLALAVLVLGGTVDNVVQRIVARRQRQEP